MHSLRKNVSANLLTLSLTAFGSSACYAQGKQACELVTKADAESVLGVTLEQPRPYAPFRSLLDKDFTKGRMGDGCEFTNVAPGKPRPPKVIEVGIEVRYSPAPNNAAVEQLRKEIDERTYEHPVDVPGLGDAAFWIGPANNLSLFVFTGGKMTLMIGPSQVDLEQVKALALKALGGSGKSGYAYGASRTSLSKPMLSKLGSKPNGVEQLKHELAAKANAGDAKAQLALGKLYQFGTLGPDGSAKPDYAGAAYWYQQASDHGEAEAAYSVGIIYREGLGVPANPSAALELFRKAADAGFVAAMAPLSYAYAAAATSVSPQRATYWATRAAEAGDPEGWLMLGYEYNKGMLGGERPYWYRMAMDAYTKAAEGGDCVAMMNIGGLYFNGNGVLQDKIRAQSWFAKAELCQGKDLDWVREKAAKYRQRAAAGRLPAVVEEPGPQKGGPGLSAGQKLIAAFLALTAIAIAADIANGPSANADMPGTGTSSSVNSSPGVNFPRSSTPAPPERHCRQVPADWNSMTLHGKNAISPVGATTRVCD
jgi:TPR repeat protein